MWIENSASVSAGGRLRCVPARALLLAIVLLAPASCKRQRVARQLPPDVEAFHRAAAQDDVAGVKRHLGTRVDRRGAYGWTALHFAAIHDSVNAARLLLDSRAAVDALDHTGMTPLHWAARKGNSRVVELLLDRKAEVMARNKLDMTPLHEARTVAVAELLLVKGADMEARDIDGMTPLHTATTKKVAQYLIKKGANINARAKDGRTPMDMPPVPVPRPAGSQKR